MTNTTFRPLGELVVNLSRMRVPVKAADRRLGSYPYYGASGVVDYVDDYLFDGLHLLVAEDGENLRSRKTPIAFLANGRFWVNNHAHVLQGNDENDTRYLSYALEAADVSAYVTGSAQPKLSQRSLNAIEIPAPSLDEQRAIAATLGALDDKIESNRRAIGQIGDLVDAYSERFGKALPTVSLGTLTTVFKKTVKPTALNGRLVDHFSLPAFDAGASPERVSASTIMSNKLVVPPGAILLSRLNPRFNRTWWTSVNPAVPGLASTEFLVFTTTSATDLAAVWLALRDPSFRDELPRRVTGTSGSHQRVRPDDVLGISVPDFRGVDPELKKATLAMLRTANQLRTQLGKLVALRDALLPELLSGRIRVPVEGADV
ncbi:restriction endonuclease subunit S [Auritidibacter sp. NML100628]|uniref:restriction endonuclease subunit S n=1 Tax=Auritidibacter sp. NML100628 TaxID=2170742 RepID=UPI000D73DC81|nr:restriction endonuclease subunit S [Auritidibacter sp. NML100628]PXA76836.1 restriction endonuclease subunit S [Auritidibacter sp. NML100628]